MADHGNRVLNIYRISIYRGMGAFGNSTIF